MPENLKLLLGRSDVAQRWIALVPGFTTEGDVGRPECSIDDVRQVMAHHRASLTQLERDKIWFTPTLLSLSVPVDEADWTGELAGEADFALSWGVPCRVTRIDPGRSEPRRYGICAKVPSASAMPRAALYLDGAPLVIRIWRHTIPLGNREESSIAAV
jgi:hypothetical protein